MNQQSASPNNPSPLFAQMLQENSSRALQWFHAADYMPDPAERRYCLERAVALDPTDSTAQRQLLLLNLELHSREQVAPPPLSLRPSVFRLIQAFMVTTTMMISR